MMNGWSDGEFDQFQMWPLEVANRSAASGGQRGKSSAKSVARQRRAVVRHHATQDDLASRSKRSLAVPHHSRQRRPTAET